MMDLKEIIKWFIPCFHILLVILKSKDLRLTFMFFFLFNVSVGCAASPSDVRVIENNAKNIGLMYQNKLIVNQSDVLDEDTQFREFPQFSDGSVGRTFGRPFKKMMAAMIPLIFQVGAASTWAVVAALVGIKTLFVALVILKLLLVAGAAKTFMTAESHLAELNKKIKSQNPMSPYQEYQNGDSEQSPMYQYPNNGQVYTYPLGVKKHAKREVSGEHNRKFGALFASKGHGHYQHGWEPQHPPHVPHPPQKEIHVHIHNSGHHEAHEDHAPAYGPWSREDPISLDSKHSGAISIDPYSTGPQTIRTPFGNYVKVDSNGPLPTKRK